MPRYRTFADGDMLSIHDLDAMELDRESLGSGWRTLVRRGSYVRVQVAGDEVQDAKTVNVLGTEMDKLAHRPDASGVYPDASAIFELDLEDISAQGRRLHGRTVWTVARNNTYAWQNIYVALYPVTQLVTTSTGVGFKIGPAVAATVLFTYAISLRALRAYSLPASGRYVLGYTATAPTSGYLDRYEVRYSVAEIQWAMF